MSIVTQINLNHYFPLYLSEKRLLYSLKNMTNLTDKFCMKLRLLTVFLALTYSLESISCDLTVEKKDKFIKSVPYFVEDISCTSQGYYYWIISNQKYLSMEKKHSQPQVLAKKKTPTRKQVKEVTQKINTRLPASDNDFSQPQNTKNIKKRKIHSISFAFSSGAASISSTDSASHSTEKATSDNGHGLSATWNHLWTESLSNRLNQKILLYHGNAKSTK